MSWEQRISILEHLTLSEILTHYKEHKKNKNLRREFGGMGWILAPQEEWGSVYKGEAGETEEWENLQEEINTWQTKVLKDHIITPNL